MPGGARLPGGERRKASQKRSRQPSPIAAAATAPALRPGDRVCWSRYTGIIQRVVVTWPTSDRTVGIPSGGCR
jgi:hypothetical protein